MAGTAQVGTSYSDVLIIQEQNPHCSEMESILVTQFDFSQQFIFFYLEPIDKSKVP